MSPGRAIRILSICDDDSIRFSREMVLQQEKYEVESVTSNTPLDVLKVRSFHIAILCHSLPPYRAAQIADMLRRYNPSIRVVRIHAVRSQRDHHYDADCEVLPSPNAMLDGIRTLAQDLRTSRIHQEQRHA